MSPPPGAIMAAKLTAAGALGFVPVVIHFKLFETLVNMGKAATAEDIFAANNAERSEEEKAESPLCLRLVQDTLFVVAGQGFIDLIDDDIYAPNSITYHWVSLPSAPHGALHFTTEALLASAFLFRKLQSTNFAYPFADSQTPHQAAYSLLGAPALAAEHTYTIMEKQGRLDSFNTFMAGKFGKFGTMPARVKAFGYDLDRAISGRESPVVMVDVGGGTGEMLLELKAAYPHLRPESLVVQEFQTELKTLEGGISLQEWNFKTSPQPIRGALNYSLTHILHNNSDIEALALLRRLADAMASHSRLLVHEFTKNANYGNMHAAMINLYAGRLRSPAEWRQMAEIVGLEITFEFHPEAGEGLIEMRKVGWRDGGAGEKEGAVEIAAVEVEVQGES